MPEWVHGGPWRCSASDVRWAVAVLVTSYDQQSARGLAAAVVTGAAGPARAGQRSGAELTGVRVVAAGGGWSPSTWRDELRSLANRGRAAALGLRTELHERQLPDQDWAQITQDLADGLGLRSRPWVAVRIGPTSVVLVTDTAGGPLDVVAGREFARAASSRYSLRLPVRVPGARAARVVGVAKAPPVEQLSAGGAAVARVLAARAGDGAGGLPVGEIAERVSAAWQAKQDGAEAGRRVQPAVAAVVDEVYPLGFVAGRKAGAEAVAGHVTSAINRVTGQLTDENDPGRTVRGLLDRLTVAAHREALRGSRPESGDSAPVPRPRTYRDAGGDGRDRTGVERAATAASVAWSSGYRQGWREAYWSANRIVNAVTHEEKAATTQIAGRSALVWLDELGESARRIADDDRPADHPARLAQAAGSSAPLGPADAAGQHDVGGPGRPAHHPESPDQGGRRPPGM